MLHGGARHIVCAYAVSSPDQTWGEGYCDDDEHGAGRHLLSLLKLNNLHNICIFGVRYYGGYHLGNQHFTIYKQVIAEAIKRLMPDVILKMNHEDTEVQSVNTTYDNKIREFPRSQGM